MADQSPQADEWGLVDAALTAWFDNYDPVEAEAVGGFMGMSLESLRTKMQAALLAAAPAALPSASAARIEGKLVESLQQAARNQLALWPEMPTHLVREALAETLYWRAATRIAALEKALGECSEALAGWIADSCALYPQGGEVFVQNARSLLSTKEGDNG